MDKSLLGTGKIQQAAIIGHDGSIWAHSGGFDLSADELSALLHAYNDPTSAYERGVTLAGTRVYPSPEPLLRFTLLYFDLMCSIFI